MSFVPPVSDWIEYIFIYNMLYIMTLFLCLLCLVCHTGFITSLYYDMLYIMTLILFLLCLLCQTGFNTSLTLSNKVTFERIIPSELYGPRLPPKGSQIRVRSQNHGKVSKSQKRQITEMSQNLGKVSKAYTGLK